MLFFVRATIPTVGGNRMFFAGTMAPTLDEIVAKLKPQAIFFRAIEKGPTAGMKAINLLVELENASQVKSVVEPLFAPMEAKVEYDQVVSHDELKAMLPTMEANVKKYGDDGRLG